MQTNSHNVPAFNMPSDERAYAFEFEATVISASHVSWKKECDKSGAVLPNPVEMHVNKYSFTSENVNGVLIEWLDTPREPAIKRGKCKIRFRQLRPSRDMFGFYELSGYPVV